MLLFVLQQFNQAIGQSLRVAGRIELDRKIFSLRHLPEVGEIGADDRHSVSTRQVRDAAASGGRGVRHDGHARALKQIGQGVFRNIAAKFDLVPVGAELAHQVSVARGLRMVSSGNHEPRVRELGGNKVESLDHELEALVRSPFSKRENALDRTAAREIGRLGAARQNAMGTQVNVIAAVFIVQNFAIARHQHRNRIRQQQHSRSHRACEPVKPFVANTDVLQIDGVHQVMQSHMRVAAAEAREQRGHQATECHHRAATERAE